MLNVVLVFVTVKLLNSCDKTFVIKNAPCMHQHTRDVTYVVPLLFKETGSPDFKIFTVIGHCGFKILNQLFAEIISGFHKKDLPFGFMWSLYHLNDAVSIVISGKYIAKRRICGIM